MSLEPLIRPFEQRDRPFILALVPRLIETTILPGRLPIQVLASLECPLCDFMASAAGASLPGLDPETATLEATEVLFTEDLFVAETSEGDRLGFIYLQTQTDPFSHEPQGHIADIVVTAAAEGQGVGTALMAKAEAWAQQHRYRRLTLNAFAGNQTVRSWYERQGFEPEMVQYIKPLPEQPLPEQPLP
ncbi:MAG: GNAT family N-acetyltransferase [Synechococcales cyanobacterium RU_4_20]|nr:GNAT family N-acetyltransferase [Synechococcales cyanobacterium RU_4_20]NJR67956.1 GNAT family N-acetyltransferase [Synechococcales cyanobacterium CRU_2_2]